MDHSTERWTCRERFRGAIEGLNVVCSSTCCGAEQGSLLPVNDEHHFVVVISIEAVEEEDDLTEIGGLSKGGPCNVYRSLRMEWGFSL